MQAMSVHRGFRSGVWVIAVVVAIAACGGPDEDVVITISPAVASVAAGQTVQFMATVTGSHNTKVNWGATGGDISSGGLYTAPAAGGGYTVQAIADANSKAKATALVNVNGEGSVLEPFYDSQHPYVQVMTPMPFATYFAPATIRVWAHAPDYGGDNVNSYSPHVDFYLGTTMIGSVSPGGGDPVDYYEAQATGVPTGSYEVFVRSRLASGTIESIHVPIKVIDVPTGGPKMDLTSDLVLSGSTSFELIGSASSPAVLTSSNGSRIRSAAGWTGHLTIRNADVIGLGKMDVPGIEVIVTSTNALEITDSIFDRCGPPALTASDRATMTIRGNTFQPNILTPVNDQADYAGSHPSLVLAGNSSGAKVFAGNNVGVSFVRFDGSSHWLVGGDHDTDGNIFMGVRAGMEFDSVTDITIRGNFSFHRYPFGWSQGHNLDFEGDTANPILVEHNVFRSSSWMIQSLVGEFRYNLLVDNINEAFFRSYDTGTRVHHNVLVNCGFQRAFLPSGGVLFAAGTFDANTIDVGGAQLGWINSPFIPSDSQHHLTSLRNNVFTGFAYDQSTNVVESGAATSADYNAFYNPDTTKLRPYGDTGLGSHDVHTDPRFAQPRSIPFPIGDGDVWRRRVTVSQILALYRSIYTPASGSPLIDAGDPASTGVDIGAVGAGVADPADKFGRFGP
ncbi:MAG: hypothetical protein E6J90_00295 [Deltaproteobacteria bacterium]|nr:MAG: hypothetical protein E6J90_00295 [Deltaproteobacteria bacterium]